MTDDQITEKMNRRYAANLNIQELVAAVESIKAAVKAEPSPTEKARLTIDMKAAVAKRDQAVHEFVVLPTYQEVNGQFAELMDQAARLSKAWVEAWYSFASLHAGSEAFPQLQCRNTAVASLVKG
jgi:hypothetical protein